RLRTVGQEVAEGEGGEVLSDGHRGVPGQYPEDRIRYFPTAGRRLQTKPGRAFPPVARPAPARQLRRSYQEARSPPTKEMQPCFAICRPCCCPPCCSSAGPPT